VQILEANAYNFSTCVEMCHFIYYDEQNKKRIQNKKINTIKRNNVTDLMILNHFRNERRSTNEIR